MGQWQLSLTSSCYSHGISERGWKSAGQPNLQEKANENVVWTVHDSLLRATAADKLVLFQYKPWIWSQILVNGQFLGKKQKKGKGNESQHSV